MLKFVALMFASAIVASPAYASTYTFNVDLSQTYGTKVGGVDAVSNGNSFTVSTLGSYENVSMTFKIDGLTFSGTGGVGFNNGTPSIDSLNFQGSSGGDYLSVSGNSFNLSGPISNGNTIGGSVTESISATPIPGSLPLFATGLGAFALLLLWRRNRVANGVLVAAG